MKHDKQANHNALIMASAAVAAAVAFVILIAYLYLIGTAYVGGTQPKSFTIGNRTFNFTSYALDIPEDEQGLMNASVTNRTFMLFEFHNSSIFQFWMKNTYTPLDIIWIEGNRTSGRVVYIVNASPCVNYDPGQANCAVYTPQNLADYVIEAKSGFVQSNNVSLYEQVRFNR